MKESQKFAVWLTDDAARAFLGIDAQHPQSRWVVLGELHRRGNRCRVLVAGRSHRAVDLTSGFDGAALRGPALATSSSTSSRCKDALPFYAELRELGPLPSVSSSETFSACGPGPNPVIGPDASPVFPTARVSRRSSRTPARAPMPPLVSPRERQPWWM